MKLLAGLAFFISLLILVSLIYGLIFWIVGNLIILLFNINYVWTIWHGFACGFIYALLRNF